jgi:hypothetical protein
MLTYTYERQDIIQIALKKLLRGSAVKKRFVRFSPPFTRFKQQYRVVNLIIHTYIPLTL